jgi:hypothetical protein
MKLLAMSLEEDARKWYKLCHDNHLASYEAFTKLFKERWMTKKDRKILLIQFNQIKREENGIVKEFEKRFDNLRSQIPKDVRPSDVTTILLYFNCFEGQFIFTLR